MSFFELEPSDISNLNDADLREMVGRLCEAELTSQELQPSSVFWGGAQEAPDGGLDVRVNCQFPISYSGFIPSDNTGIQVKKNSMGKAACKREMLENGKLKSVITDLLKKEGAYIIVSGKDDCTDKMLKDRLEGMRFALANIPDSNSLHLDFYGRDRLCSWLRKFPGVALWVRSRLGKSLSGWKPYGKWSGSSNKGDNTYLHDNHPCITDKTSKQKDPISVIDGIKLVRNKLRKIGAVVRITGLSGVGKTRFAQALFEDEIINDALPKSNMIYADLGDDLTPTAAQLIDYLIANNLSSCVVLDNCPPDVHRRIQKQISNSKVNLSLLTIEYDISDDQPEETHVIHIEPSSLELISKLIENRFPSLGSVNATKISEFSGGNARIAIALASQIGPNDTLANFSDNELFDRLFNQRKESSENLLKSAEILSLVYSFNISTTDYNNELRILSNICGLDQHILQTSQAELIRRQIAQKRGDWRAVLPHALANRLARRALENYSLQQINSVLLISDNIRLFKSCAHRLGYLHNFEPARQLVISWFKDDGPFNDLAKCNDDLLIILGYIAPIIPEELLTALEVASENSEFCSRKNPYFTIYVRILRKIAYESIYFERSFKLLLAFADKERPDENINGIVNQIGSLFYVHLSGTEATPQQRQSILKQMIFSGSQRQLEIAEVLLSYAFETLHWSSIGSFDFGARVRGYGWQPKTHEEKKDWYLGFLNLLTPLIIHENKTLVNWSKKIIVTHYRGLWSNAHCVDELENIIFNSTAAGNWLEIWMSIKQVLNYDSKKFLPETLNRLEALERYTSPNDTYSEIEVYAFTNPWDHVQTIDKEFDKKIKEIEEKIVQLGTIAVSKSNYLQKLAPRLWSQHIDSLWHFGYGIAKGSTNPKSTFEYLVSLMQKQKLKKVYPLLFQGYISGTNTSNPELVKDIQDSVLAIPELRPHFIRLLTAIPLQKWGVNKLLKLASNRELDTWLFEQISYGSIHKEINDSDLSKLLSILNNHEDGVFVTISLLRMRFYPDKDDSYIPSELILSIGRQTILKILSIKRDQFDKSSSFGFDRVLETCLVKTAPKEEICEIIDTLCEGITSHRLYSFELENIIDYLVINYTEYVLDRVYRDEEQTRILEHYLFKEKFNRKSSPLNLVPVEHIIEWCDEDQARIQKMIGNVSSYSSDADNNQDNENPKVVTLSSHVKLLLNAAKDKSAAVNAIYERTFPKSYSGSLANILEVRSLAFEQLLNHESIEVQKQASLKLIDLKKNIKKISESEANEYNQQEQRFE